MTHLFLFLMTLSASATVQDLFEKTYPRDNAFCQIGAKKIEIMIKGHQSHTDPKERMWGEYVFTRIDGTKLSSLPVNHENGLYRFFPGNPSSCTKSVGTTIGSRFAILFQKLNSPHKHKLIVQYLDLKTLKPIETVYSQYFSNKAQVNSSEITLRTFPPSRQEIEMGKVTITDKNYLYQNHVFPVWVKLNKGGFSNDLQTTYENFSYKSFFKNIEDFKTVTGWDEVGKSFSRKHLYVAIDHGTKSKCILLVDTKKILKGDESWICQ